MPSPSTINLPKQLLVEGKDCQRFFIAMIKHLSLQKIQVQDFGGISEFNSFLKAFILVPGFVEVESLGIVRDAENNSETAFDSVCSALRSVGLPEPNEPEICIDTKPRVGVFVLPGTGREGMLETLLLDSVSKDPVIPCLDKYFHCLSVLVLNSANPTKARVQAFLASRPKPGLLVGEAADAGYWPWEHPIFNSMKEFLSSLF